MSTKPPTQVAGVEGIAPKPIELTPSRPSIDWVRLFGLPPFQMYAVEKSRLAADNVEKWLPGWAQEHGEQDLFDDYCRWHQAKGYWPNETPLGEPSTAGAAPGES